MSTHSFLGYCSVAIVFSTLSLTGCNSSPVIGSGEIYEVSHTINNPQVVEFNGNSNVRIQNGTNNQLIVIAQEQVHSHLTIRRTSDKLVVEPNEGFYFQTENPVQYLLISNDIKKIELNGAIDLNSQKYQTDEFFIDASGSTDIDLTIYASKLTIDASGSFDGYLSGKASQLILDFSGSSDINAYDLIANEVDIDISGASTVYVTALERLDVSAAGACRVSYKGNPRVSQSSAGASSVVSSD